MERGDIVGGRFRVEVEADAGGMGRIYKATDLEGLGSVALKILNVYSPADRERFKREAVLLSQVRHPGVVAYVDHGTTLEGDSYLAMAWVSGRTVVDHLREPGFTVREAVRLGRRLAQALEAVHAQGIVHRDITPKNILLPDANDVGAAVLIDFGIARRTENSAGPTLTGALVGTVGYMSPEQARGESALDGRADLFALGCVLYELLTGTNPFPASNPAAVRAKVLLSEPTPVEQLNPEVPEALSELVSELLAKTSRQRPRSAQEVADRLTAMGDLPNEHRRTGRRRSETGEDLAHPDSMASEPETEAEALRVTLVVGSSVSPTGEEKPAVLSDAPSLRMTELGWKVAPLQEGWLVVQLAARQRDAKALDRLVESVRVLRAQLPGHPIAIATEAMSRAPNGIDRAVEALSRESIRQMFTQRGDVWIDDLTARLLERRHRVEKRGPELYLVPSQ